MKLQSNDRGAVAVWVAILLIPLMVVAALAIDIGAANADRQRLQHGADAAALAIAQDCAADRCNIADPNWVAENVTAQILADANVPMTGEVSAAVTELRDGWVEVRTTTSRDYWFAPVMGPDSDSVTMSTLGAASWGTNLLTGGPTFPLAVHWCEVAYAAGAGEDDLIWGDDRVVGLNLPPEVEGVTFYAKGKEMDGDFHSCPAGTDPQNSRGHSPSGGFGWIVSELESLGDCSVLTHAGEPLESSTGRPSTCETLEQIVASKQPVLIPIYDGTSGTGAGGNYLVSGYVAFQITGYCIKSNAGACDKSKDSITGTLLGQIPNSAAFETAVPGGGVESLTTVSMPPTLRLPE